MVDVVLNDGRFLTDALADLLAKTVIPLVDDNSGKVAAVGAGLSPIGRGVADAFFLDESPSDSYEKPPRNNCPTAASDTASRKNVSASDLSSG